jgi:hypothetical protein
MLYENLLKGIGVDMFASKNSFQWRKFGAQSAHITSFHPLAITSGPGHHLGAFSFKE